MKAFDMFLVIAVMFFSLIGNGQEAKTDYKVFGEKIEGGDVLSSTQASKEYTKLQVKDTLSVTFSAKVTDVCQVKGCWMALSLDNGQEAMVRFKDYGFFVPIDIVGKEVIVNGLAFVEEMSVADQRHYAKDAGQSQEEIEKITTVRKTFGLEADGVLLKQ